MNSLAGGYQVFPRAWSISSSQLSLGKDKSFFFSTSSFSAHAILPAFQNVKMGSKHINMAEFFEMISSQIGCPVQLSPEGQAVYQRYLQRIQLVFPKPPFRSPIQTPCLQKVMRSINATSSIQQISPQPLIQKHKPPRTLYSQPCIKFTSR